MPDSLINALLAAIMIGYPVAFFAGLLWASRPRDVYHEDGGWRHEESPAFCRRKEGEE